MPKLDRGLFYLPTCLQWLIGRRTAPEEILNLERQRLKLITAQTERAEIGNRFRLSELVAAEEVSHLVNGLAAIFTSQIDPIGSRLAPDLVGMTEAAEIKERIDDEIRRIRASTADIVKTWVDNTAGSAGSNL